MGKLFHKLTYESHMDASSLSKRVRCLSRFRIQNLNLGVTDSESHPHELRHDPNSFHTLKAVGINGAAF